MRIPRILLLIIFTSCNNSCPTDNKLPLIKINTRAFDKSINMFKNFHIVSDTVPNDSNISTFKGDNGSKIIIVNEELFIAYDVEELKEAMLLRIKSTDVSVVVVESKKLTKVQNYDGAYVMYNRPMKKGEGERFYYEGIFFSETQVLKFYAESYDKRFVLDKMPYLVCNNLVVSESL